MHPVKTAHHITVHHVDYGFCHCVIDALVGQHPFLNDDVADGLSVFDDIHLVARLAVEHIKIGNIMRRHDSHAIGAIVGLDNDIRFFLDTVFLVFAANAPQ